MYESFVLRGQAYDLRHLNDFVMTITIAAKDGKPAQNYEVKVMFSCHCFTRSLPDKGCDVEEHYADHRETRQFDAERHALSVRLPNMIRDLGGKKCYHAGHGNFVVVDIVEGDTHRKYAVFFEIEKVQRGRLLLMRIMSAYPLLPETPDPTKGKPIGFNVVLFNTATGKRIKVPN